MKRALITIAALLLCGAIGSAARAQTPAQAAKFNRYLSKHPGVAEQLAANHGMTNVPSYPAGYPGAQNYSSAYQTQYMKNLATYNNYLNSHPGLAASQGMGYVPAYMARYPGLQNYGGGYGGAPAYQSPYAATSYAPRVPYGSGAYGPYGSGSYGPYGGGPMSQAWHHRHFNGRRFSNSGASQAWSSHPFASMWRHRR